MRAADRFALPSVVDRYHLRPDYADGVLPALLEQQPRRVLDLGCGPGKLAFLLAPHVDTVLAVDKAAGMLDAARADPRHDGTIEWLLGDVDKLALTGPFDLATAGASIHWFNLDQLLPCLATVLVPGGRLAIVNGDGAFNPPWGLAELEALKQLQLRINDTRPPWVDLVRYPAELPEHMIEHSMFHSDGIRHFGPHRVLQPVADYIEVYFSRQSCALESMSAGDANWFRRELGTILADHARDGMVSFDVMTSVETGVVS